MDLSGLKHFEQTEQAQVMQEKTFKKLDGWLQMSHNIPSNESVWRVSLNSCTSQTSPAGTVLLASIDADIGPRGFGDLSTLLGLVEIPFPSARTQFPQTMPEQSLHSKYSIPLGTFALQL